MRYEVITSLINEPSHKNLMFRVLLNKYSREITITPMDMLAITHTYRGGLTKPTIFQAITVMVNLIII
jgi:hypothetical protein